jgi:ribokinase
MGFQTGFLGKVGRDEDGDFILGEMGPVSEKRISRDHWTGNALIILGPKRDRIICLIPNANKDLAWSDIDTDFVRSFSVLHLTSLLGQGIELQARLAKAVAGKVAISCDPGEVYAQQGLAALKPLLEHCDFLFATEGELSLMTGSGTEEAVRTIQSLGTGMIVIKKKGSGASIFWRAERWDLPADIIQARDTTGAGDVFAAGFLAGWLKGCAPPDCGRLGLFMAHRSMGGLGRAAYPGQEDFENALTHLKSFSVGQQG